MAKYRGREVSVLRDAQMGDPGYGSVADHLTVISTIDGRETVPTKEVLFTDEEKKQFLKQDQERLANKHKTIDEHKKEQADRRKAQELADKEAKKRNDEQFGYDTGSDRPAQKDKDGNMVYKDTTAKLAAEGKTNPAEPVTITQTLKEKQEAATRKRV